jgi:peptide/nickel transport system permease protein
VSPLLPLAAACRRILTRRVAGWSWSIAFPAAMLLALLACLASPLFAPVPTPIGGDIAAADLPMFSPGHLLGTDPSGNDIWSRLVYGGQTSLRIAFAVNLAGLLIGATGGAVAGYLGGLIDTALMRGVDALLAFPPLILVLAVAAALGPGEHNTSLALSFFSVPAFARLARSATQRIRDRPFILAAGMSGSGGLRILIRHVLPNILPQLIAFAMLSVATVINIEGAVSFLGLGVSLPQPSWGNMIYQGQLTLSATPWLVILPSAFLFVTILSFNLLSEALRAFWETP